MNRPKVPGKVAITAGVARGSSLGSDLWKVVYDVTLTMAWRMKLEILLEKHEFQLTCKRAEVVAFTRQKYFHTFQTYA